MFYFFFPTFHCKEMTPQFRKKCNFTYLAVVHNFYIAILLGNLDLYSKSNKIRKMAKKRF